MHCERDVLALSISAFDPNGDIPTIANRERCPENSKITANNFASTVASGSVMCEAMANVERPFRMHLLDAKEE
jgi:hypothetical protein